MAHIPTSQFVKIHGLTSSKGLALNGRVAWVHAEDASTVSERVHVILFPKKITEVGKFRSLNIKRNNLDLIGETPSDVTGFSLQH